MIAGLEEKEMENLWSSISSGRQISSRSLSPNLMKLVQLLTDCHREKSTAPILQSKAFDEKTKDQLTAFLSGRLEEPKLPISWKVEVIVANDYVQKSLHPVVEMNVDGEKFEMDLDGLAAMRLALAKALLSTDKFQ